MLQRTFVIERRAEIAHVEETVAGLASEAVGQRKPRPKGGRGGAKLAALSASVAAARWSQA
jgi:hypothetical protein